MNYLSSPYDFTNINNIFLAFQGKLVGSNFMKNQVCQTLSRFPNNIIYYITSNCWFFGSMEDAWAYTFTGNDLINQHIIILSDSLLEQNESQIEYTIAHEIGHVILKHKNSIFVRQDNLEVREQEKQADLFAKKYLFSNGVTN
jgi:hypothetical protein